MKSFLQFINENNIDSENGVLMFRAETKGGKYSIEVYKNKNTHGEYYDTKEYTNGRTTGSGSRDTLEGVKYWLANTIWGSKTIDGIKYIISLDDIKIVDELKEIEEVENVTHSPAFKQWVANMSGEEIKNLEIEAEKFYKSNPDKASLLRRKFFMNSFLNKEKEVVIEKTHFDDILLGKKFDEIIPIITNKREDFYGLYGRTIVALDEFTDRLEVEKHLEKNGYSVGKMQADAPRGVQKGKYIIEKWRNLDSNDRKGLDAILYQIDDNPYVIYFNFPE
jgi:hypothetical protein